MLRRLSLILVVAGFAHLLGVANEATAQGYSGPAIGETVQQEAPEVTIEEHLGDTVSFDTPFVASDGTEVTIGDYLEGDHPVVLVFAYHSCPMLCSLILDGTAQALRETDLITGDDFEVVSVSFNHREGPTLASAAKERYVGEVVEAQPDIAENWHFLTGTEESIAILADEVGFGFEWDDATGQYAHGAATIFISPEGKVTRYLYGIQYAPRDFRLAAVEAGEGTIGTSFDQFLLTCFRYDTETRSYAPYILNIMKLGGGLLLAVLAAFFIPMWLRERKRDDSEVLGTFADLADSTQQ